MTTFSKSRSVRTRSSRFTAGILLLLAGATCWGQDRPIVGAIRWDAWQEDGSVNAQVEATLGPGEYHDRIPFFGEVTGPDSVSIRGNSQAIMDQEIAYAANAGLDYWAFVAYPMQYNMSNGLELYLNSSQKSRINFCLDVQAGRLATDPFADWEARMLSSFADSSYQKVMSDRPLLYVFNASALVTANGNFTTWAQAKAAFDGLRTASITAGTGDPYIVVQGWNPTTDKQTMLDLGADAIGRYAQPGGSYPNGTHYATSAAQAAANWDQSAATGADVVPLASAGWDRRPRYDAGGVFWESGPGNPDYFEMPTGQELTDHIADAMSWVRSHPDAAPADTVLIYAWNEHDEGGWISPTRDLDGSINTGRIDAVAAALNPAPAPVSISVGNGSFEAVGNVINSNWQQLPDPGDWVDGNPGAIYEILDLAAESSHFPALNMAPDGVRVLNLGAASPLTQDLNHEIHVGDEITLSFHVGNSEAQADPPGDVTVSFVLDALETYSELVNNTSPDGEFVLKTVHWTATSDGELGLMFVNQGATWIDAVRVEVRAAPTTPGDADGNGVVDAADYIILKRNMGQSANAGASFGDFNDSGTTDWADLQILAGEMNAAGAGGGTIPEPAIFNLLAPGGLAVIRRRRK